MAILADRRSQDRQAEFERIDRRTRAQSARQLWERRATARLTQRVRANW